MIYKIYSAANPQLRPHVCSATDAVSHRMVTDRSLTVVVIDGDGECSTTAACLARSEAQLGPKVGGHLALHATFVK